MTKRSSVSNVSRTIKTRVIENFIIVWLTKETDGFDRESINKLREIINSIKIFSDSPQCFQTISEIVDEEIILIISNHSDSQFLSKIESKSQINSIYLLSHHHIDDQISPKIQGTFSTIDQICSHLKKTIPQHENNLTPISILPFNNLSELDQTFIYAQLMKEILFETNSDEKTRKDFLEFCRIQYAGNRYQLQIINEFEGDYQKTSSIFWYRRNCFLSMMMNKALRVQDVESTLKIGFFIRDLHQQIQESSYSPSNQNQSLIVYHGQGMFKPNVEKLVHNQGGLLSFNSFLLTNTDKTISMHSAKQSLTNPDLIGVLFQMKMDPSVTSVAKLNENEILFTMRTIFRIDEVQQVDSRFWQINLTLTDENGSELNQLNQSIRKNIRAQTNIQRLAKLMIVLGRFDKAREIYSILIESTNENDKKQLAHLHQQIGLTYEETNDLTNALTHYRKSLEISLSYLPLNDPQLCPTYSSIGLVLKKQGHLDNALEYLQHALDINLLSSKSDRSDIAIRYNNLGGVFEAQGKRNEALECYQHALQIEEQSLPPRHPLIGATHNNIGLVSHALKDYSSALKHFQKTLEIEERSLPVNHPSLIMTYTNIAGVHEDLQEYEQAISYADKAMKIVENHQHPQRRMLTDYLAQLKQKLRK